MLVWLQLDHAACTSITAVFQYWCGAVGFDWTMLLVLLLMWCSHTGVVQ